MNGLFDRATSLLHNVHIAAVAVFSSSTRSGVSSCRKNSPLTHLQRELCKENLPSYTVFVVLVKMKVRDDTGERGWFESQEMVSTGEGGVSTAGSELTRVEEW